MAQRQLSRTLPKNFTFPSMLNEEPRTPERTSTDIDVPPPPRPSSSSCRLPRVRVRSGTDVCARMDLDLSRLQGLSDVPLPSIEIPQSGAELEAPFSDDSVTDDMRFLAPPRQRMLFKTPPAQIRGTPFESCDTGHPWPSWDQTPASTLERPGSVCSNMSDSSIESIETFASRPSIGGSCTSAESDIFENFPWEVTKEPEMESPTKSKKQSQLRPSKSDKSWSRDMDNHLWNTYQLYLQDPTITPFKMTPGSIPPLGITHRVARRAKRTWEKKRLRIIESLPIRSADRSGSSTPKAAQNVAKSTWPKSDTTTRRRLKQLCRRKFSISPHYQRMMQSRSPEPVAQPFIAPVEPNTHDFAESGCMAYGTRDLGVSLVAPYEPTPLSRLAEETVAPEEPKMESSNNPVFNVVEYDASETSPQNLHVERASTIPRLGSPFAYSTWGPSTLKDREHELAAFARRETIHLPRHRSRSNAHSGQKVLNKDGYEIPLPEIHVPEDKDSDDEVRRRLEMYLRENKVADIGNGRMRIRSRGATTGAVSPKDVNQLFSPPSSLNSCPPEETTPVTKPPTNNPLLNLSGENIKRLGSPFRIEGGFKRREGPGRYIKHASSLSDPFSSGGPPSYQSLAAFDPSPIQEQQKASSSLPYDPTEEGLSDAERIRRQILNMPFTRR
ncbi:hypothetical protein N7474_007161 [Penicillium riverlandense]|uniref:uncharacterized protein n=1 Tax=Penicillium riverlandense TaxID=1903569 RepID=UPI002547AF71|nr:uncharacterized protein N7474_007161 [Penicillium riverlandense]KAJ5815384.1 hypothetical protein N7474_007161 [Penicillium riverlandense]